MLIAVVLLGCKKELDVTNPNFETVDAFWQTQQHAIEGINAVYSGLIVDGTYMRMLPASTDGRGDDFRSVSPWESLTRFSSFTMPAAGAVADPLLWVWRDNYQVVYRANQVIHHVPNIEIPDEELRGRIMGQAYFLRGLAHFNLATNFKQVPLIDFFTSSQDQFYPPTATEEDLWNGIISDFVTAKGLLPESYDNVSGPDAGEIGRATWGSATGMLGKALLYRERWGEAFNEFNEVITSGRYDLMPDYVDNFKPTNENNMESLFEVQFSQEIGGTTVNWCCEPVSTWMNVNALGVTYTLSANGWGFGDFVPSPGLYEAFQEEATTDGGLDPRLLATIASYEPSAQSTSLYLAPWPQNVPTGNIYPRKYTHNGISTTEGGGTVTWSGINYRILRFSDVLLMAAEAQNEMGNAPAAAQLIQRVRDRANLPDRIAEFSNMSQAQLRDQLGHERYLELAIEGIRIHDLVRWGWFQDPQKLAELQSRDADFTTYQPGNEYLPIPQTELDVNPNLSPNSAN